MNPLALKRKRELQPPPEITNRPVLTPAALSPLSPDALPGCSLFGADCPETEIAPAIASTMEFMQILRIGSIFIKAGIPMNIATQSDGRNRSVAYEGHGSI